MVATETETAAFNLAALEYRGRVVSGFLWSCVPWTATDDDISKAGTARTRDL
jgi:hypothetical protein